jgi:hypothetical protein
MGGGLPVLMRAMGNSSNQQLQLRAMLGVL